MTTPTLYRMTGMSFAGKTTLARAIHAATGITLVEPDAIAVEKGWPIESGTLLPEQWRVMREEAIARAEALLRAGRDVLFDTTATSPAKREYFRGMAAEQGATIRFIAVCISYEEARKRWERNNTTQERFPVSREDFEYCARAWVSPIPAEGALFYQAGEQISSWITRHFPKV